MTNKPDSEVSKREGEPITEQWLRDAGFKWRDVEVINMPDPITPDGRAREWLKRDDVFQMRWHWADPNSPTPLSREDREAKLLAAYAAHCSAADAQRIKELEAEIEHLSRMIELEGG